MATSVTLTLTPASLRSVVSWSTQKKKWIVEGDDDPMGARQRALAAIMDALSRWCGS